VGGLAHTKGGAMLRGVGVILVLVSVLCLCAVAESFDFYRAGSDAVGLFNNLTGEEVDGLILRFSGSAIPTNAIGIGGSMQLASNQRGELQYSGFVVPNGTWEVDWAWEGPRLEYATWLHNGAVVGEIPLHNPTAAFGMMSVGVQSIRFFAPGSADPDGFPLVRYLWQWSDGVEAEGVSVDRTLIPGEYEVALTVWDVDGNKASRTGWFEILEPQYILTVNIVGQGAVAVQPNQAAYFYGDTVTLTAVPVERWDFIGWNGDLTGTNAQATITITGDMSATANFDWHDYLLTISKVGDGTVTATPNQTGYHYGTVVALDPEAAADWSFAGWSGDLAGTDDPVTITIAGDTDVTADFEQALLQVAFEARVGSARDIFVANVDGSGLTQLTDSSADDWGPQWSPDGSQIAFLSTRLGFTALFVMNADGSDQHPIDPAPTVAIREFEWSNTDKIVMAGPATSPLYVIAASVGVPTTIDSTHGWDGVHISGDGLLISGSAQVINSDGSGYRYLGGIHGCDLSPDGLYGAYKGWDGSAGIVYIPTNAQRTVANFAGEITGVYWSPDGNYLFTSSVNYPYSGSPVTYVYRFDGSTAYTLSLPVVRPWDMSADNSKLAVLVRQDSVYSVGVVDLASSQLTILYSGTGDLGVTWSRARFSPR
jgi:WD40 repeat protein